jgi:hypothetical protein
MLKSVCKAGHDLTAPGATYEYDHPWRGKFRMCKRCTRARAIARSRRAYVPNGIGQKRPRGRLGRFIGVN